MSITVGITHWKRPDDLQRLIDSLDAHPQMKDLPRIVMDTGGNLSAARNKIFERADTEFVFVLEEDMTVTRLDLEAFETVSKDLELAVISCRILLHESGRVIEKGFCHDMEVFREDIISLPTMKPPRVRGGVEYHVCDLCPNVGLFRRIPVANIKWDPELYLREHQDFFWRLKQQHHWRASVIPSQFVDHYRSRPDGYRQDRDRAHGQDLQRLLLKKHGRKFRTSGFPQQDLPPGFPTIRVLTFPADSAIPSKQTGIVRIPKVFHRVWLGGKIPIELARFGESWLEHNPGWRMETWTEDRLGDLHDLINWDNYNASKTFSEKSDFIRHAVLSSRGGVYVDADFECIRCIEPLLYDVDCFAASEDGLHISCGLMGAVPEHPFYCMLNKALREDWVDEKGPSHNSGPQFVSRMAVKHGVKCPTVFPPEVCYPVKKGHVYSGNPSDYPDAYAIHHWNASWREFSKVPVTPAKPMSRAPRNKLYFVCVTPRSGSTYFVQLLRSTEVMGTPGEYYNTDGLMQTLMRTLNVSWDNYFEKIISLRATANGVSGIKVSLSSMWYCLGSMPDWAKWINPRYIMLTRDDVLRQAISTYRAQKSGAWQKYDGYPYKEDEPPDFNEVRIRRLIRHINLSNDRWNDWFRENGINPLRMTYEQICEDPEGMVRKAASFIEVDLPSNLELSCTVEIQRDGLTEEWVQRMTR